MNHRLEQNSITSKGGMLLFEALKDLKNVNYVSLYENQLDDNCITALGLLLQSNQGLESVFIGKNNITDAGIQNLEIYLKDNITLKALGLSFNKGITDASVPTLIKMINTTKILSILICGTAISAQNVLVPRLTENILRNKGKNIDFQFRYVQLCFSMSLNNSNKIINR